jgi:hypothetical protein
MQCLYLLGYPNGLIPQHSKSRNSAIEDCHAVGGRSNLDQGSGYPEVLGNIAQSFQTNAATEP